MSSLLQNRHSFWGGQENCHRGVQTVKRLQNNWAVGGGRFMETGNPLPPHPGGKSLFFPMYGVPG